MQNTAPLIPLQELLEIMARLRAPDGCPWDRQQTPESLKSFLLEESYELLDAIDDGSPSAIRDELGDLLLQIVFLAQIFAERDEFTIADVARSITAKLIRRHPHIYSSDEQADHELRWETIKRQERRDQGLSNRFQDRLSHTLPALKTATKLAKHRPESAHSVSAVKVKSQLDEFIASGLETSGNKQKSSRMLGLFLFEICSIARNFGLDPEESLRRENRRQAEILDQKHLPDGHES